MKGMLQNIVVKAVEVVKEHPVKVAIIGACVVGGAIALKMYIGQGSNEVEDLVEAMDKADSAYPEKNPSKPEEKEEEVVDQTTKAEGVIKSIVQTVIGAMVSIVTGKQIGRAHV